jgi:hypothetical protein
MGTGNLTDEKIAALIAMPKRVTNPGTRLKAGSKHEQLNYNVVGNDDETAFQIFVRQSLKISESFSCGLLWISPSGETVTLVRYNGTSHPHENCLEGSRFEFYCHIHKATERYIVANKKPETFAEKTDRYRTLNGALNCLLVDCAVTGLVVEPENQTRDLFDDY